MVFDGITNLIYGFLEKIYTNGYLLNNVDEIWDIIDNLIAIQIETAASTGKITTETAEELFIVLKQEIRKSKINELLEKFNITKVGSQLLKVIENE
jgi:hypothetical protein